MYIFIYTYQSSADRSSRRRGLLNPFNRAEQIQSPRFVLAWRVCWFAHTQCQAFSGEPSHYEHIPLLTLPSMKVLFKTGASNTARSVRPPAAIQTEW